jgi:hypothetical protein
VRRLPVPDLPVFDADETDLFYYGITTICCHGQLGDRMPIRLLGWVPGHPVTWTVVGRIAEATEGTSGGTPIGRHGHLRLPAIVRHQCRIERGDRLLVAATPEARILLVYPLAAVHQTLAHLHQQAGRLR